MKRTPFPATWYSIELKGYRDHPKRYQTYSAFPYEALPPLPRGLLRGEFQWLNGEPEWASWAREMSPIWRARVEDLTRDAAKLGPALPDDFVRFMGSSDLIAKVRSVTGCTFEMSYGVVESPARNGFMVCFLEDSQDCLFWHLFLGRQRRPCVVSSAEPLDGVGMEDDDDENEIVYCAPSFEAFIYRWWIENEIWYAINEGRPLTDRQKEYVGHYERLGGS